MMDGSWWFCSRKGTWTKHEPGKTLKYNSGSVKLDDNGRPITTKETITRFGNTNKLRRTMGHCKPLMDALDTALMLAA